MISATDVAERPTAPRRIMVDIHCPKCGYEYEMPGWEQNGQKMEDGDRPDCPRCEQMPEPVWAIVECPEGHRNRLPALDSGEHRVVVLQRANPYPRTPYPHCPEPGCGIQTQIISTRPRRDE